VRRRSLLASPFSPFLVIFCYVITTFSQADLKLLGSFVESLRRPAQVSAAAGKLHKLCNVFYTVAKLYVDAKAAELLAQEQTRQGQGQGQRLQQGYGEGMDQMDMSYAAMADFDHYLSALGVAPFSGWSGSPGDQLVAGQGGQGQDGSGPNARDWFSGNTYLMGLLEQDSLDMT
jgi:hypothetical protein